MAARFVDDTNIDEKARQLRRYKQRDFDGLVGKWRKYEVVHFGRRNKIPAYYLRGRKLKRAATQRNLSILVHETKKANIQKQHVIGNANGILALNSRGLENKNRKV